jgi:hypothetical protein
MSAGTGRTTSTASAHTHGRNRSGSGSRSRRVSAGSKRTSVSSKLNAGEVDTPPPPFVDNPEARMRADPGAQQTTPMTRSNTTASIASRHERLPILAGSSSPDMFVQGVSSLDEDPDRTLGHDQGQTTNDSDEGETIPRHSRMESMASEDDDDASIYTQSSIGRESVASVSRAQHSYIPSISKPPSVPPAPAPNLASTVPAPAPSAFTSPRPAPLSLAVPNGQTTIGPSPLLHTTWGSPISSTPGATPDTGSGKAGYTPLFAGGLDALSRALAAGVAAVVGTKASGASGDDGGGAASALPQPNAIESRLSPTPLISKPIVNTIVDGELQAREAGLGHGRGVIIEDEDEALVLSPLPGSLRAVGESVDASGSKFGTVIRESPEPEPAILVNVRSAPLVVANRTPSPTETSEEDGGMEEEEPEIDTQEKERTEEPSSPSVPPSQISAMPSSDAMVQSPNDILHPPLSPSTSSSPPPAVSTLSPSPLPSPSLRPSLHELRGGQPGTSQGQRRSLFLPHPNAPKAPSAHSPGPMYVAQQHPPPQSQAQSGAVQTIKLALAGRNSSGKPTTIYGRTQVELMASVGPVLMIFSVDPPPPTPQPMKNAVILTLTTVLQWSRKSRSC